MAPQNLSTSDIHVCVCLFSGGPSCVDQTTEAVSASLEISEIHVRSGALIDKIEIHYRDGTSIARGTNGGGPRPPFVLQEGEKLVKIQTRQGDSLDGCQFFTDAGRSSQWYGGHGGSPSSFLASAQDPIIDIQRASTGCCPRITGIVRVSDRQHKAAAQQQHLGAAGAEAGAGARGGPAAGAATTAIVGAVPAQAQAAKPIVAASQLGVVSPWTRYFDPRTGKFFYNNSATRMSQWHEPC